MRTPRSFVSILGRALAGASLAALALATQAHAAIAPTTAHSPNAEGMRTAYWVMFVLAILLAVPLVGGLVVAARRFRATGAAAEPRRLTAGRGVIGRVGAAFGVIVLATFIYGITASNDVKDATAEPGTPEIDIDAISQQWLWRFEYPAQAPGGASPGIATVFSFSELVVPVDTKVNLHLDSTDVLHSWFVPALGPQVIAVPGEIADTSFIADEEGLYKGQGTVFDGTSFPSMRFAVRVVSKDEYDSYVSGLTSELLAGQKAVQNAVATDRASQQSQQTADGTDPSRGAQIVGTG